MYNYHDIQGCIQKFQDSTHPSGKFVNYKRLACYEHCPGTFGYTLVYAVTSISRDTKIEQFNASQSVSHKGNNLNTVFTILHIRESRTT